MLKSSAPSSVHGVMLVLCAALLWGTTGTAQNFAPLSLSPYMVGALRLLMAAVFFALVLLVQSGSMNGWRRLPWPRVWLAAGCMAAYNLMFFAGVKASSIAIGTAVAIGSGPIWAGLLQFVLSRHAPSARWWLGTLLAVVGGCTMVLGGGTAWQGSALGLGLCLGAGLSYAVYALVNKAMVAQAGPTLVTATVFGLAAAMAMPLAWLFTGPPALAGNGWVVVAYLGFVATGLAYLLFSHGLQSISGATGVTLALGEPVTAFALATWVVGERPGLWAGLGLCLVLAGLALVIVAELRSSE